jgi:hypothetical protein
MLAAAVLPEALVDVRLEASAKKTVEGGDEEENEEEDEEDDDLMITLDENATAYEPQVRTSAFHGV